jgi:hypothetical protein
MISWGSRFAAGAPCLPRERGRPAEQAAFVMVLDRLESQIARRDGAP